MTLMEILADNVIVGLKGQNKQEIIKELIARLDGDKITDRDKVLQAVLEREDVLSTGIGNGVAIPHGKSENVTVLGGVLGIKSEGINFDSLDGKKTYIFFLLVSPLDVSGPHIKAFARVSRVLKREGFRERLIGISNREEALTIIEAEEGRLAESGGDQVGSFVETSSQ